MTEKDLNFDLKWVLSRIIDVVYDVKDILKDFSSDRLYIQRKLEKIEDELEDISNKIENLNSSLIEINKNQNYLDKYITDIRSLRQENYKKILRAFITGFIVGIVAVATPFALLSIFDSNALIEIIKLALAK